MSKEIVIHNSGPIKRFRIEVPDGGGVVELQGTSGVGKSHALNAINAWASHRGTVPIRDGAAAAEVEGVGGDFDGVTARFSRRSSFNGELEVEILAGKFDIADLIDPGLQDPKAADSRRIKALVQLATGEDAAKPDLFYDLLDGGKEEFEQVVSLRAQSETDVVTMAAQIKRDLEAAARREAELLATVKAKISGIKTAIADVDLTQPFDQVELTRAFTEAVTQQSKLETESAHAKRALREAAEAQAQIDSLTAVPPIADLQKQADESSSEIDRLEQAEIKLKEQLARMRTALELEREKLSSKLDRIESAKSRNEALAGWQATINRAKEIREVPDEELTAAAGEVVLANRAIETGALVRRAKEQSTELETLKATAREISQKSEKLRSASQGTDAILSKIVQQLHCPLTVSRGRLVTETDRGEENFADLSDGERVRLVIPIAIEAVKRAGRSALLVVGQRFWQDLSPENQSLVAELVQGTGVGIITARVTDDPELRAEILDAEPALSLN